MKKALRDLFVELRKTVGTQDDVADSSGVSQGLISRIEKDTSYNPSTDVFFRAVIWGLRMPLSAFFLQLEKKAGESAAVSRSVTAKGDKHTTSTIIEGGAHALASLRSRSQKVQRRVFRQFVNSVDAIIDQETTAGPRGAADTPGKTRQK